MKTPFIFLLLLTVFLASSCVEDGTFASDDRLPVLESVMPETGKVGDTILVEGRQLADVESVYLNGALANLISADPNSLLMAVPEAATSGPVSASNQFGLSLGPEFTVVSDTFNFTIRIDSISPNSGNGGDQVNIYGVGFNSLSSNYKLYFNGLEAQSSILFDGEMLGTVPEQATSGSVSITNSGEEITGPVFIVADDPQLIVQSINPTAGQVPIEIIITGQNFGTDINDILVTVNGAIVTVNSILDSTLSVSLSQNITTGIVSVERISTEQQADGPVFTVIPPDPDLIVQSINPDSGQVPVEVTITGEGFGNNISDIEVLVNGVLVPVITVTNTIITVNLPQNTTTGAVAVRRISTDQEDVGPVFTVLPPDPVITVSTLVGASPNDNVGSPFQIVSDGNGGYYYSDPASHRIKRVSVQGVVSNYAGNGQQGFADGSAGQASFNAPAGLAIDPNGVLYVADLGNHSVRRIDVGGNVTTVAGSGQAGYADGFALQQAQFNQPIDVVVDGNLLFISDFGNHAIRLLNMQTGMVSTFAGNGTAGFVNGNLSAARFRAPIGISFDTNKNILVADGLNHSIRLINRGNSTVSTVAGNGSAGFTNGANAQFNLPYDVSADADGVLYVADRFNHSVRKIDTGITSTLAGTGVGGFQDGVADQAQFANPLGLVVVSTTELLLCDFSNGRIRKITIE